MIPAKNTDETGTCTSRSIPNVAITKYINILFKIKEVEIGRTYVIPHIEVSHGERAMARASGQGCIFHAAGYQQWHRKKDAEARNLILLYIYSLHADYI